MEKSNKAIMKHIPDFLDYCEIEKGLSNNTQKNYEHYLKKFSSWLKENRKTDIKPYELTDKDIWNFRLYLSRHKDPNTQKTLKKITQHYYLIALRALLAYFTEKNIASLPQNKVKLPKYAKEKEGKTIEYTLNDIETILSSIDVSKEMGLRDRAILEILIFTGSRIGQVITLNRDLNRRDWDKIHVVTENIPSFIYYPKRVIYWINKYLKSRDDKSKALFINYRSRKSADRRLTVRSVERMVNKYAGVTPEALRNSYVFALLNEETKIKIDQNFQQVHKTLVVSNYTYKSKRSVLDNSNHGQSKTWNDIENIINKEAVWLKNNLLTLPREYQYVLPSLPPQLSCNECILRKIAILIISGKVTTTEFLTEDGKDLWDNLTRRNGLRKVSFHGKWWHQKMISVIHEYFKRRNYKVALEPDLAYGRADLGIYPGTGNPLFVEIGTVSLYKLWRNIWAYKNVTFLLIPSEKETIELRV